MSLLEMQVFLVVVLRIKGVSGAVLGSAGVSGALLGYCCEREKKHVCNL